MRIKLGNEPWLIVTLTILLAVIIIFFPSNVVRIIFGLPLVIFFPGYMLIAALFPRKGKLGGIERVALGFGLSIAVVSLMGYILNYTPWGIRLYPVLISIVLFITVTSIITWYRRHRLPEEERVNVTFHITLPHLGKMHGWDRALSIFLVTLILAGIGTLGYVAATPKVGERFTEFYILGFGYEATDYPKELAVGEEGRVVVKVVNHEKAKMNYRVEVKIDVEKNGEVGPIVLEDEQEWEERVSFTFQKAGEEQKVEFLLHKQGQSESHQTLHLLVDVIELK